MKRRNNIGLARSLRRNANTPEQIAWEALRTFRQQGYPVRRQHPVGRFVVDFAIVKEKLAIEIDGGVHAFAPVAEKDANREKVILEMGWRLLRVPAEAAMSRDHLCALVQKELGL